MNFCYFIRKHVQEKFEAEAVGTSFERLKEAVEEHSRWLVTNCEAQVSAAMHDNILSSQRLQRPGACSNAQANFLVMRCKNQVRAAMHKPTP
eukprot:1161662-Pelagomonas_calceolata.AAC.10